MFGANWCPWCRKLDHMLAADGELLKLSDDVFVKLNVDVGQFDRNPALAERYLREALDDTGIPMLVVLRRDGSVDRELYDVYIMLLRQEASRGWRISHLMWHRDRAASRDGAP